MSKYRQTSYYTLKGIIKHIELPDSTYGEWIVYDNKIPKYHINSCDKSSNSDILILDLIQNKIESIDDIINKINNKQGTKLSLGKTPYIELIKTSELVDLELSPLPEVWIKNL
jgi:hypothetical protein